ncbi:MAG: sugar phosphate isomerase/epimerase [Verrucomicrobiaceae bacterium]|nr:MAG: sugar phosphate isomerase/epimerase [Verrucomicrobiaceae bacterium]
MRYTGIADEAGNDLATQIRATRELGWRHLEMRNVLVPGFPLGNVHDIPAEAFDTVRAALEDTGVQVVAFGSSIGNWASQITDPFEITLERVTRAIPRMQALGTRFVRIMSYAILKDADGRDLPDQLEAERFRRLREIKARFDDAGLVTVHENCMNYGGMSVSHALRTLENVPGLRWVFDTGNPVFNADRDHPGRQQDAWAFYQAVKPAISHIHIKDGHWNASKKDCDYTLPGEGQGQVARILTDVLASGYEGFLSIEPHTSVVFHSTPAAGASSEEAQASAEEQYQSYLTYGRALEQLVSGLSVSAPVPA